MRHHIWTRTCVGVVALSLLGAACSQDDGATVRDLGAADGSAIDSSGSGSASAIASGSASGSAGAVASGTASSPGTGAERASVEADGDYEYASDVAVQRLLTEDVCDIRELLDAEPVDWAAIETVYREGEHAVADDGSVRTLAGFATSEDALHGLAEVQGSPTPLDDWMTEALDGAGRFAGTSDRERAEAVEKGAQNQILVAWTVHELRAALADAAAGDLDATAGAPHLWDEAWAFYHGAAPDCAPFSTATARAGDFGTLAADGRTAVANEAIIADMEAGREALLDGDAEAARDAVDEVLRELVVTYSQAAIRYATLVQEDVAAGDQEAAAEHRVEGLAFFRVMEALVADAGADVAAVEAVFDLDAELGTTGGGDDVRAALEPAWDELGITAADIGTLDT